MCSVFGPIYLQNAKMRREQTERSIGIDKKENLLLFWQEDSETESMLQMTLVSAYMILKAPENSRSLVPLL